MDSVNNGDLAAKLAEYRDKVFVKGWDNATDNERLIVLLGHMTETNRAANIQALAKLPEALATAFAAAFADSAVQSVIKSAAMAGVAEALGAHPQQVKTLREHAIEKGPWAALGGAIAGLGWLGQYLADHWGRH